MIGVIIVAYIINSFAYELGKVIFGKIANYRLVYTNILGFTWTKNKDDKLVYSYRAWENYGSATVMAPSGEDDKCNPGLYLTGGLISLIVVDGIILILGFIFKIDTFPATLYCAGLINALVGVTVLMLNAAPFLHDGGLDGFYLRLVTISDENKKIYHNNLRQLDALYTGRCELNHYEYDDYHNIIAVSSLFYNHYYYLDNGDETKAREMLQMVLDHKDYAFEEEVVNAEVMMYYFKVKTENIEKVSEDYWGLEKSTRKACTNISSFGNIRIALLVASLVEGNYDLYEFICNKIDSKMNRYKYVSRIEKEDKLIDETLKYIETKKPDWFKVEEE